jgi:pimeloyl-ACP methyl ester carboxylesterase
VSPIIFVHGAGLDAASWRFQTDFFAESVAVDLPGHGSSPLDPLDTVSDYAKWLVDWARHMSSGPVTLVGHSMGSLVVLEAAATNPDFVDNLVLIATSANMAVHRDLLAAARRRDPEAAALVTKWSLPKDGGFGRPKKWVAYMRQAFAGSVAGGVMATDLSACETYSQATEMAATVACPALLILGERDVMTKPKTAQPLAAALPDARIVMLEGAGHMLPLERPAAVNEAIALFLSNS